MERDPAASCQTDGMSAAEPTWIVVVRDVSENVQIEDRTALFASLVLDADTGLVRGVSLAPTARDSCREAAEKALTQPAAELAPNPPVQIVYGEEFAPAVLEALSETLPPAAAPMMIPNPPIPEAEDILDSLLGHLSGRAQPDTAPEPADWAQLFERAADYCRAEPWQLRADDEHLDLSVTVDDTSLRYVAVVIGQQGVQRGLALYPGTSIPDSLADWEPGDPPPVPEGSLVLWLDPRGEVPGDLRAKAERYGWPADLDLAPILAGITPGGLVDLDRTSAQHLTVALAAVIAHARPHAVPSAVPADGPPTMTGGFQLADGSVGQFSIS